MIWLILGVLLFIGTIVVGIVQAIKEKPSRYGSDRSYYVIGRPLLFLFLGAGLAFFGNGLGLVFTDDIPSGRYKDFPLANLADGTNTTGSFFLGSGTVSDSQVFAYYAQDADGGYRLDYKYASNSRVFLDETDQPFMREVYLTTSNRWIALFPDRTTNYEFHVPAGSIQNNYYLDAE